MYGLEWLSAVALAHFPPFLRAAQGELLRL